MTTIYKWSSLIINDKVKKRGILYINQTKQMYNRNLKVTNINNIYYSKMKFLMHISEIYHLYGH